MSESLCTRPFRLHIYFSGYICISLPEERLNELEIPMMVPENQERHKTAYTITVDYKHGLFLIVWKPMPRLKNNAF
jgi:hypothetical protein